MNYNGMFRQSISVIIEATNHEDCLKAIKLLNKQCDAWYFCVKTNEHKSARKGPVLKRELMIYQEANSGDILIFKEAIRRICSHLEYFSYAKIRFIDKGSVPIK